MERLVTFCFIFVSLIFHSCGHSRIQEEAQIRAAADYQKYCSSCHFTDLGWFKNRQWKYGNSDSAIFTSIKKGFPDYGMPSFSNTLTDQEIKNLTHYIQTHLSISSNTPNPNLTTFKTEKLNLQLQPVITGLDSPWGLVFLPDGDLLISERAGKIIRYKNGTKTAEIQGVPPVHADGQGGLFDIRLHPDYAHNSLIYLAYNAPSDNGWNTAIMKARLQDNALVDQQVIFKAVPDTRSNIQFGGRITFDGKGHVFFSTGDTGQQNMAQDLTNDDGKIFRLNEDGSVPSDNPFVNQSGARPGIWSYGHRNPEGLIYNAATGILWEHEHGPMGGDELNIIEKGKNYGWPVITYGKNYDGTTITNETSKTGMEQPVTYWVPSIAPSGMDFADGKIYKPWAGNILIGSLKFRYVVRCELSGNSVSHQEIMFRDIGRLRNVATGPDGYLYIATELPGTLYKLVPVQ